jgi:hypothetical protein
MPSQVNNTSVIGFSNCFTLAAFLSLTNFLSRAGTFSNYEKLPFLS